MCCPKPSRQVVNAPLRLDFLGGGIRVLKLEIMQNNNKPITSLPHPYCTLSSEDVEYARYLDRVHGRVVAKNYLRAITDPGYLSTERLAAVKRAEKGLERAAFKQKVSCPPEGWKFAIRKHIWRLGDEILAVTPDIQIKDLERAITKSYSYGPKADHPYKVWREELKAYLSQVHFERTGQRSNNQQRRRKV